MAYYPEKINSKCPNQPKLYINVLGARLAISNTIAGMGKRNDIIIADRINNDNTSAKLRMINIKFKNSKSVSKVFGDMNPKVALLLSYI